MIFKNFKFAMTVTLLALVGGFYFGGLDMALIVGVLSILEISLSLDNAVVNASVLKNWDPAWQDRFMTWGIPVAVAGMRLLFPIVIVAILGNLSMLETVKLASNEPAKYAAILVSSHREIAAFGGAFLLMVCFKFLLDPEKEDHWVPGEKYLTLLGRVQGLDFAIVTGLIYWVSTSAAPLEQMPIMVAGLIGLVAFIITRGLGDIMGGGEDAHRIVRAGVLGFVYLEVLDASFSFDGVIGAFALSNNIWVIAAGLGVGAIYIRSMTLVLIRNGSMDAYRYLEHGALWAIGVLGAIMMLKTRYEISEVITGLSGAALIALAVVTSIVADRREKAAVPASLIIKA